MHIFERAINGHRYRIAAQSVWDPVRHRSVARQTVLGPASPPPVADLGATRTIGTCALGDVGALVWVAEQLAATLPQAHLEVMPPGGILWRHRAAMRHLIGEFLS